MPQIDPSLCLNGDLVILEPLSLDHVAALTLAASDGRLWELWVTNVPDKSGMKQYVKDAIASEQRGETLAFAVRDKVSGNVVGSTRICHWDQANRRLEIGYTWYAKQAQRTGINTQVKQLLLTYAFNNLDCIAVEFRTHWHNKASRTAILRLGAKQDGVLRHHKIQKDGTIRDTVVYSIIASEWPQVEQHLKQLQLQYVSA
ncbi:GNAT family N-acetyltransferase [Shewanella intestini]|uniref:GNAT family N-acetyltransferase n=1 Tax=Shewanella intestini TaxID=2017544 RepID=A0ABS5I193_9GAMM|nr:MULTISPECIES: GNAT family protein [Shewanella]MBR9727798.1 GNAT family N-acetyltransferase [Shewanella intestini]MRG36209.1 GNAT family N-acetyltransferase [Shewanella sp. XMDDZSB0408]